MISCLIFDCSNAAVVHLNALVLNVRDGFVTQELDRYPFRYLACTSMMLKQVTSPAAECATEESGCID